MSRVGIEVLAMGRDVDSKRERYITVKVTIPEAIASERELGKAVTDALIDAAHMLKDTSSVWFTTHDGTVLRAPCDQCVNSPCNCPCGANYCGCPCHR